MCTILVTRKPKYKWTTEFTSLSWILGSYGTLVRCWQWMGYIIPENIQLIKKRPFSKSAQAPLRCLPGDMVASIFRVCWSRMCLCRALLCGWAFEHRGHSILACHAALEFPELFFGLSLLIKGRDTLTLEWVLRCTVIVFFSSQIWKQ